MAVRPELIERLRKRLGDPIRRTYRRMSLSQYELRSATEEELRAGRAAAADKLNALIDAHRRGEPPSRRLREEALAAVARMKTAAPRHEPVKASSRALEAAARRLGFSLPEDLASIYTEVADGGFGPGYGLLSIAGIAGIYERLRSYATDPPWPQTLLPISDDDGVLHCIDRTNGAIVRVDPERLNDDNSNLFEAFEEAAPNLEHWLEAWLNGPSRQEIAALEAMRQETFAAARESWRQRAEAYIAEVRRQSPEDRAKLGLKEDGWEEQLRRDLLGPPLTRP